MHTVLCVGFSRYPSAPQCSVIVQAFQIYQDVIVQDPQIYQDVIVQDPQFYQDFIVQHPQFYQDVIISPTWLSPRRTDLG